ncbi:MAG: hypothetical protein LUI87_13250, partial [Lachnospiraceae bacterium]|nr:hypothetical protein [Lachnospiraceae bacterium]
ILTVYDIAGEMFNGARADDEISQKQFHYCNGFLLILDPFSEGRLRESRLENGGDPAHYSEMPLDGVVTNFINYMRRIGQERMGDKYEIPVAVLITKSDEEEVREFLSEDSDSETCRAFLENECSSNAVYQLEMNFSVIRYFPVSAIGHVYDGSEFVPWGIEAVMNWLLSMADGELAAVCRL